MHPDDLDASDVRIAVVCGSDEIREIDWTRKTMVDLAGNNDAPKLMYDSGLVWRRYDVCPSYFRKSERWDMRGVNVIFNAISDPDRNAETLDVAEKLIAQCRVPAVNPPAAVRGSTRDGMAQRLQGIPHVLVPRAIRIRNPNAQRLEMRMSAAGITFPAIVRPVGRQTGRGARLCRTIDEALPVFTGAAHEYYVTPFVDFASSDGLYRKCRFICIGDAIVPRHKLIGPSWSVHAKVREAFMAQRPALETEFDEFLRDGLAALPERARAGLEAIRSRAGLDYFGIDCHVSADGDIVVFEVNATMTFWRSVMKPDFVRRDEVLVPARAALRELMRSRAATMRTAARASR